jgi:hypothetical protein
MRSRAWVLLVAVLPVVAAEGQGLSDVLQDDAFTGGDAGDTLEEATPFQSPNPQMNWSAEGSFPGDLYPSDDTDDWYKFNVDVQGTSIFLSASIANSCPPVGPPTPLTLELRNGSGEVVASATADPCASATVYVDAVAESPGSWYAHLHVPPYTPLGVLDVQVHPGNPNETVIIGLPDLSPVPVHYVTDLWCDPFCVAADIPRDWCDPFCAALPAQLAAQDRIP